MSGGDLGDFSLLELYRQEAEGYAATLSEGLLSLERGAPATAERLEPLMRAAHSIKGAARIVGLQAAERVAHAMEDILVAAQQGAARLETPQIDTLLSGVDLLTETAALDEAAVPDWEREHAERVEALVAAIRAIATGGQTPAVAKEIEPPGSEHQSTDQQTITPSETDAPPVEPAETARPEPADVKSTDADQSARASAEPPEPDRAPAERTGGGAAGAGAGGVVRVAAESLTQLLSLAGESLVEVRQLRPLVDALRTLRARQVRLSEELWRIERRAEDEASEASESPEAARRLEALTHARDGADRGVQELDRVVESLESYARRNEELAERLHVEVVHSRMRPLAEGLRGFPRLVRDVAKELGKRVRFEVVGEETGVDRDILDRLDAPLNHLIRNALDHAIETPEQRAAAGKPPEGTIRLEARHHAGMLQLTLSDDGRGIDPERLRERVVERGLAAPPLARQLSHAELFEFLFLPGFSTKGEVTTISGRGVGLDVVQSMVQSVGGQLQTTSELGVGTSFHLRLAITLSVIRALLVLIEGEPYAFPLTRLDRVVVVRDEELEEIEGRPFLRLESEEPVGILAAGEILELTGGAGGREHAPVGKNGRPVVIVSDRGQRFGLVVDELLIERDLDVRPLDPRLGKVPDLSGASVLDDGRPVLILDVEDLVRSIDARYHGHRFRLQAEADAEAGSAVSESPGSKRVLVVDDSITVRELERQLLANRGYEVETAVDGIDGWNALRQQAYDLVVTDVDMPRLDGVGLVERIRGDDRLKGLPVVIVSYKDRPEDRARGLDAGADSYLTKSSFHDDMFVKKVVELIGEARRS